MRNLSQEEKKEQEEKIYKWKKIRKDKLRRLINKGKVLMRCTTHLTDDYAFDSANNHGIMEDFLPARIGNDHIKGYVNLYDIYFGTHWTSSCVDYGNGEITFYAMNNLIFRVKFI